MTYENIHRHRDSPWWLFWTNLKAGHDWFLLYGQPLNVVVGDGEYCLENSD